MAYTDAATLKQYLGITSSTDDALLTSLIARAQAAIDAYTGRTFEAASDTTRYFDAAEDVHDRTLLVRDDLCQITSVTNGNGDVIGVNEYATEPRRKAPYWGITLKLSHGNTWTWVDDSENAIAVVGRWAYSITAPADVVSVCVELAALIYKRRDSNSDINRPVIAGNATILPAGLSQESRDILNSLRRRV